MKQTIKALVIMCIFLTSLLSKSNAQSCSNTSQSGYCSIGNSSYTYDYNGFFWEMTLPTGHLHYEMTAYSEHGNAQAHVWTGINDYAYAAGNYQYSSVSNTLSGLGSYIYFDGDVWAYYGSASVSIYGW